MSLHARRSKIVRNFDMLGMHSILTQSCMVLTYNFLGDTNEKQTKSF